MSESKEEQVLYRSKEKLKRDLEKRVLKGIDAILDVAEVAIGDPQRYKPFRSKVLRAGNDAIRDLKNILDRDYKVLFVPSREDIVEVREFSISKRS